MCNQRCVMTGHPVDKVTLLIESFREPLFLLGIKLMDRAIIFYINLRATGSFCSLWGLNCKQGFVSKMLWVPFFHSTFHINIVDPLCVGVRGSKVQNILGIILVCIKRLSVFAIHPKAVLQQQTMYRNTQAIRSGLLRYGSVHFIAF